MLIQVDLVSIQAKQFAIDSFIFLHEIIPRGRKKSNVLCKNSTSIKACFVILDWGEPEASSQFNHISNAGLPGEGDWVLLGLGMFPLALGAFGVLRLRSPDFPQGTSSPAGSEGSRVVRAEAAQISIYRHLKLILTTRRGVLQVGWLRKTPELRKQSRSFSRPDWVAQDHSPHKWKMRNLHASKAPWEILTKGWFWKQGSLQHLPNTVLISKKCLSNKCSPLKILQRSTVLADAGIVVSSTPAFYFVAPNCPSIANPSLVAQFIVRSLSWMLYPVYQDH